MAETELVFSILAGLALFALTIYLLFGGFFRAFLAVGFTREEAAIILLGGFMGGLFNIPLFEVNGWLLAVNVGGGIVPVVVTVMLLRRNPTLALDILVGAVFVTVVTYLITTATPEGIVTLPFAWLLPPMAAAGVSLLAHWRERTDAAPIAYASGTLGAVIGADVLRLPEFLAQTPPVEGALASLGGAAVFDMVFLTGVVAVLLDMMFFRRRAAERPALTGWREYTVFDASSSPDAIRDWTITRDPAYIERTLEAPHQRR